ncbi:MAG TPA: NAD(P)H-hydrate dehydratase [Anaerolineae bacterium]|nr:NAD(P)H-hydrate dehydratase [Anaerolineae bacterium]
MPKIVTVAQMRAIEKDADATGLSYAQMMENAGKAVADAMVKRLEEIKGRFVLLLVGSGNNGGDALVAGHYLAEAGAEVAAYLIKPIPGEDPNLARLVERGLEIDIAEKDRGGRKLSAQISKADAIIDGLLGTGFELPLRDSGKKFLSDVNMNLAKRSEAPFILAVDCPSGLECDTGEIAGEALHADLTVTFAAAKPGLLRFPGGGYVGEIQVANIGIEEDQKELAKVNLEIASADMVRAWLPERPKDAHKGTFGRVVVVAGSINYPGAAALAGLAAYRVGSGLVTMAVPGNIQGLIAAKIPEATWIVLPHELGAIAESAVDVLGQELKGTTALLIGPGFGQDPSTAAFLKRLLSDQAGIARGSIGFVGAEGKTSAEVGNLPPCIVDADGLKLLKKMEGWEQRLPSGSILTPHPGEMAVLTDEPKAAIQADRVESVRKWAKQWGHVVVLKGAFTVIAAPDSRATVLPFATSALAKAGTGDVLAGAIAGFRAQGVGAYEAAILGAYVHAQAGIYAAQILGSEASVLAGEVAETIPYVMSEL